MTLHQPFDLARICDETFVRAIDFHQQLPSTNDRAIEILCGNQSITPLLVLAAEQTAGRGRGSNGWWSTGGGLTFSLIFDPRTQSLSPENFPRISLAIGVAICETVRDILPNHRVGLKWPNDVWLDDRKVSGILVEVPSSTTGLVVIGVGMNINNSLAVGPGDIQQSATSLYDASGETYDLTAVLIDVLNHIDRAVGSLGTAPTDIAERWQQLSVLTNRDVTVAVTPSLKIAGQCRQIAADGTLQIVTAEGIRSIVSGHVVAWK